MAASIAGNISWPAQNHWQFAVVVSGCICPNVIEPGRDWQWGAVRQRQSHCTSGTRCSDFGLWRIPSKKPFLTSSEMRHFKDVQLMRLLLSLALLWGAGLSAQAAHTQARLVLAA